MKNEMEKGMFKHNISWEQHVLDSGMEIAKTNIEKLSFILDIAGTLNTETIDEDSKTKLEDMAKYMIKSQSEKLDVMENKYYE